MTENGYLIWIVAMAIMTIFVLTIGTLAAADMFAREKREEGAEERPEPAAAEQERRHLPAA
jgi:hypothetical protein